MKKSVIYEWQRRIAVLDIFLPTARRRRSATPREGSSVPRYSTPDCGTGSPTTGHFSL
jgi:hypothetical protein